MTKAKAVKFNDVPDGAYFAWKDHVYRRVGSGRAIRLVDDLILDFGLKIQVKVIDRPRLRMDVVIQYLDWALLQAHANLHHGTDTVRVIATFDFESMTVMTRSERSPKK